MNEAEILRILQDIVCEAIGNDALVVEQATTAKDVAGWDSVRQVMIILAVEERFDIALKSREIDRIRSVGDFLDLIAAKTT